jgi:hypothetical protein
MTTRNVTTLITIQFTTTDGNVATVTDQRSTAVRDTMSEADLLRVIKDACLERTRIENHVTVSAAHGCVPVVLFWKILEERV